MVELVIRFDTSALSDTVFTISVVQERLAKCHGDQFRALDSRISRLMDEDYRRPEWQHKWVGEVYMIIGPDEMTDIIREARRLGVIS